MRRTLISLGLIGVLGVTAAACGSSNSSSTNTAAPTTGSAAGGPTTTAVMTTAGGADHNDADVSFAEKMIPHHQQALTMAAMALDAKAGASAAVKALATTIDAAQTPEIEMMQGWLDAWNVPMSAANTESGMDMGGSDMGGSEMGGSQPMGTSVGGMGQDTADGMMSDADMQTMSATTGPAFDKLWLAGMIAHHQGAIAMANTEKQSGSNADARTLADSIATGQAKEVTEMQQLLGAG